MKKIISLPLFKENCKRYWGCSVLAFVLYFLCSSFIILIDYEDLSYYDVSTILDPGYFPYVILDICIPIVACVIMFSYFSRVNSTTALHSMPFSRRSLFFTNYLSGLVLSVVPMVLNCLVLLLLKKPVYVPNGIVSAVIHGEDIYTVGRIVMVMLFNILVMFFTYSIAAFSGMISGNVVIHLLTSFALNFLPAALFLSFMGIAELFYNGYSGSRVLLDWVLEMHPGTNMLSGRLSGASVAVYLLVGAVLIICSYLLYEHRKLELAGNSYVFSLVKYLISIGFMYFPGVAAACVFEDGARIYIGLIVFALLGFAVGWMIISKSFKILNKDGLKAFVISLVVSGLLFGCTACDITGYQKRVPKASNVEYVEISSQILHDHGSFRIRLDDPENIQHVINVHNDIKTYLSDSYDYSKDYQFIEVIYHLENGRTLERRYYNLPKERLASSADLKAIYESSEMDEDLDDFDIFDPSNTRIEVMKIEREDYQLDQMGYAVPDEPYGAAFETQEYERISYVLGKEDDAELKARIISALVQDIKNKTFEEQCAEYDSAISINLMVEVPAHEEIYRDEYSWIDYNYEWDNMGNIVGKSLYTTIGINENYENCYKLFKELGWLETLI